MTPAGRRSSDLLALALGVLVALAILEGALRLAGRAPWPKPVVLDEPTVQAEDPLLGWTNRDGRYHLRPGPGAPEVDMTFWPLGARASAPAPHAADAQLLTLGCSVTQGWGLSDRDTYAWKLQEQFPELEVRNYGTAGYGSWQSYLTLQRVLPAAARPALVLYGFIEAHEARNVATAEWLDTLARYSSRGHVDTPYATLDAAGNLVSHAPVRSLTLPLSRVLATSAALQQAYMALATRSREGQARAVTEKIILAMSRFCAERGVPFAVVLLLARPDIEAHYERFLAEHGVETIACVRPLTKRWQLPGNPHPNAELNAIWASCIGARVREILRRAG